MHALRVDQLAAATGGTSRSLALHGYATALERANAADKLLPQMDGQAFKALQHAADHYLLQAFRFSGHLANRLK